MMHEWACLLSRISVLHSMRKVRHFAKFSAGRGWVSHLKPERISCRFTLVKEMPSFRVLLIPEILDLFGCSTHTRDFGSFRLIHEILDLFGSYPRFWIVLAHTRDFGSFRLIYKQSRISGHQYCRNHWKVKRSEDKSGKEKPNQASHHSSTVFRNWVDGEGRIPPYSFSVRSLKLLTNWDRIDRCFYPQHGSGSWRKFTCKCLNIHRCLCFLAGDA